MGIAIVTQRAASSPHNGVAQGANSLDFDLHDLLGTEVNRRFSLEAHPIRGTGQDQRVGEEGKAVGEVRDDPPHREYHVGGVGSLHHLPIQAADDVRRGYRRQELYVGKVEDVAFINVGSPSWTNLELFTVFGWNSNPFRIQKRLLPFCPVCYLIETVQLVQRPGNHRRQLDSPPVSWETL
jgi:hypothetical protein